jgi:hypothetical protein
MPALQSVAPGLGWLHVPIVPPAGIVQMPPQHSPSCAHELPLTTHHEPLPQVPPALQKPPQHSLFPPQGLPSDLQFGLSGVHVPLLHKPPQHWPFEVHEPLSAVHELWHTPLTHDTEQQSVFAPQVVPAIEHVVGLTVHPPCGSHTPEQQSVPAAHEVPNRPQTTLASGTPDPGFFLLPQATSHASANAQTNERFM